MRKQRSNISTAGSIGILNPIGLARAPSLATRSIGILNPIGLPGALKPDGINLETFSTLKDIPTWMTSSNSGRSSYENNNMKLNKSKCKSNNYNKSINASHLRPRVCIHCRRRQYAVACLGKTCIATRWQEWCVPLLPDVMVGNAASTLKLIEMELNAFLGHQVRYINALSRIGAGLEVSAADCLCSYAVRATYEQNKLLPHQVDTSHVISGVMQYAVKSSSSMHTQQDTIAGTKSTQTQRREKRIHGCKQATKRQIAACPCRWIGRERVKQARCHAVWQFIQGASRER